MPKLRNVQGVNLKLLSILEEKKNKVNDLLEIIKNATSSRGRDILERIWINGEVLKKHEAIEAMCCQCQAYYEDGKVDCDKPYCPLYPFMPYGKMRYIRKKRQVKQ